MKIGFLVIGLYWIIVGIVVKRKKWLWIHQGIYKKPVDVEGYSNYMGFIDIVAGISCVMLGAISFYVNIPYIVAFIILITYSVLTLYGENKYKKPSSSEIGRAHV